MPTADRFAGGSMGMGPKKREIQLMVPLLKVAAREHDDDDDDENL